MRTGGAGLLELGLTEVEMIIIGQLGLMCSHLHLRSRRRVYSGIIPVEFPSPIINWTPQQNWQVVRVVT